MDNLSGSAENWIVSKSKVIKTKDAIAKEPLTLLSELLTLKRIHDSLLSKHKMYNKKKIYDANVLLGLSIESLEQLELENHEQQFKNHTH